MGEQVRNSHHDQATEMAAEAMFRFSDFTKREQSWLIYQRWRYRQGLLTELPAMPEQARVETAPFSRRAEPARLSTRRLGWFR